jgi:hypothetical protein
VTHDPLDSRPRWGEVGIHGVHRLREWDAIVTASAPGLAGDELEFVVADGVALDAAFAPLAAAVPLEPPFRAHAVRRGERWAVAARRIDVVELAPAPPGDELVLSFDGRDRIVELDGMPDFRPLPELERLGAARYDAYVVRATRLDRAHWEVSVSPL